MGSSSTADEDRSRMWRDYLTALEEERRKIEVFGKELPLCLDLIVQTIQSYKTCLGEREEERRGVGFEFIPINESQSASYQDQDDNPKEKNLADISEKAIDSDWLKSAQLWNPQQHHQQTQHDALKDITVENGGGGDIGGGEPRLPRKRRRCWLPELHRSFLRALDQLGGSEVATPKQIREVMNVEGLTNDEVKSHLQKYRLQAKRPSSLEVDNNTKRALPPQQHQVMFGLWMPPAEYAAISAAMASNFDHRKKMKKVEKGLITSSMQGLGATYIPFM